jgi:Poly(A) polymerase central domain
VYGNVIGFPAGVQLAILVARICQLYPNAVSAIIVTKMFKIFAEWRWPLPIYLKTIEEGDGSHKVWNPKVPTTFVHRDAERFRYTQAIGPIGCRLLRLPTRPCVRRIMSPGQRSRSSQVNLRAQQRLQRRL